MSRIDRRAFLRTSIGATVLAGLGGRRLLAWSADPEALRAGSLIVPSALAAGSDIVAAVTEQEVWRGTSTPLWTLGGQWPAPTISIESGEEFTTRLVNNLEEPTIVHWHGILAPAAMDGHPRNAIGPGETYDYRFVVRNRAGTYWYHPHPDMATGRQVYMGMAGFFIVHDAEERGLGLPSGDYDLPILIQDRVLDGIQRIAYEPGTADHIDGYLGDRVFVNGFPDARRSVDRGLYRLRLLNGANARVFTLAFADNRSFQVVGTDGGLLDRPYDATSLVLSPGERVEIIVDFSSDLVGTSVEFLSSGFGVSGRQSRSMRIMLFEVDDRMGWRDPVPSTLVPYERLDPNSASLTRSFQLRMEMTGDMPRHMIGEASFDMNRIDVTTNAGAVEIWEFTNLSPISHPMHIHNAFFQILSRNGAPPTSPVDFGWKDTILVRATETVRAIVRFGAEQGVYVFHCHNLEHEDKGMMLNLELTPGSMGVERRELSEKMNLS